MQTITSDEGKYLGLLNLKQQRFVHEYLIDLNGKQAAIRAGYAAASAEVTASRLLSQDKVSDAIK
jgi:phage terminase small subunit